MITTTFPGLDSMKEIAQCRPCQLYSTHFYIVDGVYDPSSYFSIFIFEIGRVCIHILWVGN